MAEENQTRSDEYWQNKLLRANDKISGAESAIENAENEVISDILENSQKSMSTLAQGMAPLIQNEQAKKGAQAVGVAFQFILGATGLLSSAAFKAAVRNESVESAHTTINGYEKEREEALRKLGLLPEDDEPPAANGRPSMLTRVLGS